MKKPQALRPLAATWLAALLLAGCGGGGGGGNAPATPPSSTYGPSSSYANVCTLEGQQRFVRSYLDEVYLWFDEIPTVDPAQFTSVPEYFNALLVRTPDSNGLPKDRFSAILPASVANGGLATHFGPVQQFDPQTQSQFIGSSVPVAKVVTSPAGRRSGYIQFVDHDEGAQDQLISAFRQMRDAGVQDLVLDMRFNSGGFLYVALAAASMVTGPANEGRVFEQLRYNSKRSAETASSFLTFSSLVQFAEPIHPRGTALPQLGLPRLYVLTSGHTCSSSESIINSLRGIDVEVILVGATTCGKPYGFTRKENCSYALFPIEFQGFNAKGFGDYTAGFAPTCPVSDNASTQPGSAQDPLLTAALSHMDTGLCPMTSTRSQLLKSLSPDAAERPVNARPAWAGRLLREP